MNRTFSDGSRRLWKDSSQPLTNTLLVASVVLFLCDFARLPFSLWLDCVMPTHFSQPWRLLTYPIVTGGSILALIFNGLLLWQIGGSLERGWGTKTFGVFYAAIAVLTALAFAVAASFTGTASPPGFLVLAALLVGWCTLNPDETINLYGIIPLKSRYLAAGGCVIIFFLFGWNNPLIGLMALVGCGFAVLWVKRDWAYGVMNGRAPSLPRPRKPKLRLVENKNPRPRDDRFTPRDLNPFEWIARRKRRKQFEKLMRDD